MKKIFLITIILLFCMSQVFAADPRIILIDNNQFYSGYSGDFIITFDE